MHPTVQVFLAGGVPEVMLHLRRAGLLETGRADGVAARRWARCWIGGSNPSGARSCGAVLRERDGVDPDDVIMDPDGARAARADVDGDVSRRAISRRAAR